MDVETTFLNGILEETIYMEQPQGFVVGCLEKRACKLIKSIYGLKQPFQSWNLTFDERVKSLASFRMTRIHVSTS